MSHTARRRTDSSSAEVWPSTNHRAALRRKLTAWYDRHARDMPWRQTSDPYAIWISEVMLQQTQVATVRPYFERFLTRFPDIAALAAASEHDVLRLWEGLGYYRRARQLHKAARQIVERHGGEFPRDIEAVRSLPGIGRYTAGAILSIAFDQRQPILEANTVRLLSRLLAFRGDVTGSAGQKLLWSAAEELLPRRGSGRLNQALMELGSQICLPRETLCLLCPLAALCPTRQLGLQTVIPSPAKKPIFEDVLEAAVIVENDGRVLLRRRPEGERWAGLWDFPRFAVADPQQIAAQLRTDVRRQTGVAIGKPRHFATLRHGVTRFRITLECYRAACRRKDFAESSDSLQWAAPEEFDQFALSTTGRRIARLLQNTVADGVAARPQTVGRSRRAKLQ